MDLDEEACNSGGKLASSSGSGTSNELTVVTLAASRLTRWLGNSSGYENVSFCGRSNFIF